MKNQPNKFLSKKLDISSAADRLPQLKPCNGEDDSLQFGYTMHTFLKVCMVGFTFQGFRLALFIIFIHQKFVYGRNYFYERNYLCTPEIIFFTREIIFCRREIICVWQKLFVYGRNCVLWNLFVYVEFLWNFLVYGSTSMGEKKTNLQSIVHSV